MIDGRIALGLPFEGPMKSSQLHCLMLYLDEYFSQLKMPMKKCQLGAESHLVFKVRSLWSTDLGWVFEFVILIGIVKINDYFP